MSIFPTKILLATDGSEEAQLAATTAADLAQKTNSELHLITVGPDLPLYELTEHPADFEDVLRKNRREAKDMLEQQAKRIEESGVSVKETHLREGRAEKEIVELAEELGGGFDSDGQQGPRQAKEGFDGQCLGCGCPTRPLPGHHSQKVRRDRQLRRIPKRRSAQNYYSTHSGE